MLKKINSIITGWRNVVFESKEVEAMAKARALVCAPCDKAAWGLVASLVDDEIKDIKGLKCDMCDCPLSAKLRSPTEKCGLDKWK